MEASGDKALEGGGDGAAGVSAAAWGNSVDVEHDANRKPSIKAGRRRMDFSDWFISDAKRNAEDATVVLNQVKGGLEFRISRSALELARNQLSAQK